MVKKKKTTKRKANPGRKKKLRGATPAEQRQYEAIKKSELKRGVPLADAKRIAAATVRARAKSKRNPSYTVEAIPKFTDKVTETVSAFSRGSAIRQVKKKVAGPKNAYRYRVEKNPRKRNNSQKAELLSLLSEKKVKHPIRIIGSGRDLDLYFRNYIDGKNALNVLRKAGYDVGRATEPSAEERGWMIEATLPKTSNPKRKTKRRRNKPAQISMADISKFPPNIQAQIRAQLGNIQQKQQAAASKAAKASTSKQRKAATKALRTAQKAQRSLLSRIGTKLRVLGQTKTFRISARDPKACRRKILKVRARHVADAIAKARSQFSSYDDFRITNPTRKKTAKKKTAKRKTVKKAKNRTIVIKKTVKRTIKRISNRKRRRNESPEAIRRKFAGRYTHDSKLHFPDGTPQGLAKLGKLVKIETTDHIVKPNTLKGEVWLCADTNKRLHLGATTKDRIYDGPAGDLGEVEEIEYLESKPHLGYGPTRWFHEMGEDGGERPKLVANGKGELRFKGGSYGIKREGITG